MEKNKKMILIIVAVIILIGIIVVAIKGFHVGIEYGSTERYQMRMDSGYTVEEIKKIAKEVYGNKAIAVEEVEIFHDIVSIRVSGGTEEELNSLLEKMNEKYGTEFDTSSINNEVVAAVRLREIVVPYIKPLVISMVVILAYICTRYRKLGIKNILLGLPVELVLGNLLLLAIVAITRIPITPYLVQIFLVISISYIIFEMIKLEKLIGKAK